VDDAGAPIGMVILDLDGRFQRVNQAVCDITGYDAEDLLQMAPFAIVLPEDLDHARAQFTALGTSTDTVGRSRCGPGSGSPWPFTRASKAGRAG